MNRWGTGRPARAGQRRFPAGPAYHRGVCVQVAV